MYLHKFYIHKFYIHKFHIHKFHTSLLLLLTICCLYSPLLVAKDIRLIALFKDKAMVKVNGKQILLHKNKKNRQGLLLLSADTDKAVIRYNDQDKIYQLNMLISTSYIKKEQAEVILWANNTNMFTSNGKINGKNVHFLVDTGATSIAMSESQAKYLGISYRTAPKGFAQTASEIVNTWQVTLNTVDLGDIKLRNVGAIVIQGNQNSPVLLGMTFLSQLKMTRSGKKMHLLKKY